MFESKRFWMYTTFSLLGLNLIVIGFFVFFFVMRPALPKNDPFDPIFNVARKLELTQAQRDSMRTLFEQSPKQDLRLKMMELRHQAMMENTNPEPDVALLDSLYNEIGTVQVALEKEMFTGMRQLQNISTPEQRVRYNRMIERMDKRFNKHRRQGERKKRTPQSVNDDIDDD
ncbi:periplasmic heavy metal sensor [bacterium]|nr:MAG: periplasmic heavy metal sensor [bacterium]